jgi:diacylglycerol kinase family enzyme
MSIEIDKYIFTDVAVVTNPGASRHTDQSVGELDVEKYFPAQNITRLETMPNYSDNVENLGNTILKSSLVIVRSGDGGVSEVVSSSIKYDLDLTIIPTTTGDMNDLANTVNDPDLLNNPSLLALGTVENIYPIKVVFQIPDESREGVEVESEMYALQYFGTVATGITSEIINNRKGRIVSTLRKHELGRLIVRTAAGISGLVKAKNIGIDIIGDKATRRSEILFINGEKMAGGIVKTPIEITDNKVVHIEARNRLLTVAKLGHLALTKKLKDSEIITGEFNYSYRILEDTWIHIDGQSYFVPRKTLVSVSKSDIPVKIVFTKKLSQ